MPDTRVAETAVVRRSDAAMTAATECGEIVNVMRTAPNQCQHVMHLSSYRPALFACRVAPQKPRPDTLPLPIIPAPRRAGPGLAPNPYMRRAAIPRRRHVRATRLSAWPRRKPGH